MLEFFKNSLSNVGSGLLRFKERAYKRSAKSYFLEFLDIFVLLGFVFCVLMGKNATLSFCLCSVFLIMIYISLIDLRHKMIPDLLIIFLFGLAVLKNISSSTIFSISHFYSLLFAISLLCLCFAYVGLFKKPDPIGMGDIKLVLVLSFFFTDNLSYLYILMWSNIFAIIHLSTNYLKRRFGRNDNAEGLNSIPWAPSICCSLFLMFYLDFGFYGVI